MEAYDPFLFLFHEQAGEEAELSVIVQDPEANDYTAGANPNIKYIIEKKTKKNILEEALEQVSVFLLVQVALHLHSELPEQGLQGDGGIGIH